MDIISPQSIEEREKQRVNGEEGREERDKKKERRKKISYIFSCVISTWHKLDGALVVLYWR